VKVGGLLRDTVAVSSAMALLVLLISGFAGQLTLGIGLGAAQLVMVGAGVRQGLRA